MHSTASRWFAILFVVAAAGCASSGQMRPSAVARLERASAAKPNDANAARALGIAYYKAGRFADARAPLDRAARLNPKDGTAALYLGLTAEKQGDIRGAKAAYQSYIRYGRTSKVRRQLESRLALLTRQELLLAAKEAVQQEQTITQQQGSPKTVAVSPLRFVGNDSTLQPLERGLAELITTDLARSHELTVVERARLQAVIDELARQSSGQTDSSTNVRAGKLMQAGSIVNGQIAQTEDRLRIDAAIVSTATSLVSGGAAEENTLEQVFTMEKAIVMQLLDSLGVRLTTAERNAIEQRPTRSLLAFLAYSRGLAFEDQGLYDDAARSFREAARIDPSFSQAQQKGAQATSIVQGAQVNVTSIEGQLTGTTEGAVAEQAAQGGSEPSGDNSAGSTADNLNSSVAQGATDAAGGGQPKNNAPPKDAGTAGLGGDNSSSGGTVKIVVRIPHP